MVTYPATGASPCRALTMPVSSVIDVTDLRIRDYQLLGDPRELRSRGLFVAEGRLVVERMLPDARYAVDSLRASGFTIADSRNLAVASAIAMSSLAGAMMLTSSPS